MLSLCSKILQRIKIQKTLVPSLKQTTEVLIKTVKPPSYQLKESKTLITSIEGKRVKNLKDDHANFESLVLTSNIFVDKTMLIKDFLSPKCSMIVTRPRRWGKTVGLRMIEQFFQPDVDNVGRFDLSKPNRRLPLFMGGKHEWNGVTYSLDLLKSVKCQR